jgi:DNA-binding HxlR family transcriptional regulator
MSKKVKVRDRVLLVLAEVYPSELRFSELRERLGNPSRSVFSGALRSLEGEKLIVRTEISYKHVTYCLNAENYEQKLHRDKETIETLQRKMKQAREP